MAATEGSRDDLRSTASLWAAAVSAALALPGTAAAQWEGDPTRGQVSVRWLSYQDWQPGLDRITVQAPAVLVRTPVAGGWSAEAQGTVDSVSGASPRWHSAVSGASRMNDERRAGDLKVTRRLERATWSAGVAVSGEDDFLSRTASVQVTMATDDNNRAWSAGMALTRDRIGSSDDASLHERRRTREVSLAVTQVLARTDVVQVSLGHSAGKGFYSDPYKRPDLRPRSRHHGTLSLRWNHHVESLDVSVRSSYRYYRDSFGIRSHTVQVEPVVQATPRITLTPSLRAYTQRAAWFYYDPVYSYLGEPLPPGYGNAPGAPLSADHRLSAFGALTLGLKVSLQLPDDWSADLKLERYEQRGAWRVGGDGSPGLAPFSARFVQVGLARRF